MHCGPLTDHQDASSCLGQHFNQTATNVLIWIFTNFNWENLELLKQWIDIKQQPTHILLIEKLIYGQVH